MPYKDPSKQRAYDRDYKRLKRGGESLTPSQTLLPVDFRIETAKDAVELLAEQMALVRSDEEAGTIEKARTIGYLIGVALKAIEAGDTVARLEAVESVLKARKAKR
jgi:hypothetical protein